MTLLSVTVLDDDPAEVDRLYRGLYDELRALDVDEIELVLDRDAPPLAKSDPATITALIIALATSPVLVQLGAVLRDWVTRDAGRTIVIREGERSVELTGGSADENAELVRQFFQRKIDS